MKIDIYVVHTAVKNAPTGAMTIARSVNGLLMSRLILTEVTKMISPDIIRGMQELGCDIVRVAVSDYKRDIRTIATYKSKKNVKKLIVTEREINAIRKFSKKWQKATDEETAENIRKLKLRSFNYAVKDIKGIRKFIGNDWYQLICDVDPDLINLALDKYEQKILGKPVAEFLRCNA